VIYTGLKYQGKIPWDYQYTLLKNGQEGKINLFQGWFPVGGGGHKERVMRVNM
jgi:hypothetical protein